MNPEHYELMIKNLTEENRKLRKQLEKQQYNGYALNEKLNVIRLIFSTFENCKSNKYHNKSSIILFGPFLENLFYKKPIDNTNLQFYINKLNIIDTHTVEVKNDISKFFNIINNIDFFQLFKNFPDMSCYHINKNSIKFKVEFYDISFGIKKTFFNIQNIALDSLYGLTIKNLTELDIKNKITDRNIALLNILKSNYVNEAINIDKNLEQKSLNQFIINQEILEKNGFKIKGGIKTIKLIEPCSICYEKNVNGIFLNCRHIFCINCIKNHLKHNLDEFNQEITKTCPMCRSDLHIIFE